jgi:dihydroxyacetone kinase
VENTILVDKTNATTDLLTAALTRLHGYGMTTAVDGHEVRLRETTADAIVRIGYGGHEVTYAVALKRG